MKTELYNNVNVVEVVHSDSKKTKLVVFADSQLRIPELLKRFFKGPNTLVVQMYADREVEVWMINDRQHYYEATCRANVLEMLRKHKGKRYVYICAS